MGRVVRRARRPVDRRPATRFLQALPRVGASLPPASALGARRADHGRQERHRRERVEPAVLGAHVHHHRQRGRQRHLTGRGLVALCNRRTARCAPHPRPRSPKVWRRVCARARSCSTRCSPTRPRTTVSVRSTAGSRAATSTTRRATNRCRPSSTRWCRATTSRSGGTRSRRGYSASTASPTTTAWRRSRQPKTSSGGTRRATSCSTRTARSRPSSPMPRSASSTNRGSTRRCDRASVPGAFCAYTVPSHHPYLLLNWTARRRDVLTLAHELGHGLHAYLARDQIVFQQSTPLTLAETASVFGETVTFGRLLEETSDPAATARAARGESRRPDRHGVPSDRNEPF